jgi:alanine racemase
MRAEARIDLDRIAANITLLKGPARTPLMAVVKADAYGHGLVEVGLAAERAGADWLGVALLEEAIKLRTHRVRAPILAWLVPPGSVSDLPNKPRIHIEFDTGMSRGGFLDEWDEFLKSDFSKVHVVGVFSHFARADEPEEKQNADQLKRFNEMVKDLADIGVNPEIKHLSNSAATLKNSAAHFDLVRTGISLYGLTPDLKSLGDSRSLGLKPAMQLRAKLHLVKSVPANTPVGYGATAHTSKQTKLGVVAMGYADGIPRVAQGAGVFVDGVRAPIIGRVSMDQFVVDLGPDSTANSGDWVIVFGDGSRGEYTADDWGTASGSINYEIVTRIGPRVPRIYAPHVY